MAKCPVCGKEEVLKQLLSSSYYACPDENKDERHRHYYKTGEVLPPPIPDDAKVDKKKYTREELKSKTLEEIEELIEKELIDLELFDEDYNPFIYIGDSDLYSPPILDGDNDWDFDDWDWDDSFMKKSLTSALLKNDYQSFAKKLGFTLIYSMTVGDESLELKMCGPFDYVYSDTFFKDRNATLVDLGFNNFSVIEDEKNSLVFFTISC